MFLRTNEYARYRATRKRRTHAGNEKGKKRDVERDSIHLRRPEKLYAVTHLRVCARRGERLVRGQRRNFSKNPRPPKKNRSPLKRSYLESLIRSGGGKIHVIPTTLVKERKEGVYGKTWRRHSSSH